MTREPLKHRPPWIAEGEAQSVPASYHLYEITKLEAEVAQLRTDNERLKAAIAYVRMRSAHACEMLNEFDNTRTDRKP